MASTREREQISKPNIPREEKKKGESKNYWGTTFFFSSSLLLFFFFLFGESSKARFLRDCATIRVSQVKSSQVRQEEEQGEQGEQSERETRGRGRQGLSVRVRVFLCACFCVCERVCVHKARFGKEGDMLLLLCVCVYVQRGPSPHPPSKRRLLRTKLLSTRLFFKIVNVYSYSLVFCVLLFFLFFCFTFQL